MPSNTDADNLADESAQVSANSEDDIFEDEVEASPNEDLLTATKAMRAGTSKPTVDHFAALREAEWAEADCAFTVENASQFIKKRVKEIKNPEVLAAVKASVVQIKSLKTQFDEQRTEITHIRDDLKIGQHTYAKDKVILNTLISNTQDLQTRLTSVEATQTAMDEKIDDIQASLELLTSVLIPDDAKKGERIKSDKCKTAQTLRKKDDANDGGGNNERRTKHMQESQRKTQTLRFGTKSDVKSDGRKSDRGNVMLRPQIRGQRIWSSR